jgi:hypothetical protein
MLKLVDVGNGIVKLEGVAEDVLTVLVMQSIADQWQPPKKFNKAMSKCRYSDKYKALRKPTCGCDECEYKWILKGGKK